ncbi:saccharopine dehydrogenase [Coccomyxa subellipsoidea C-169]|uniref:Saccharopine dehydrogenase n=1 Tax=Coccomyxa subellipsoidea (strain C-169) TaxID=574566 RepID=I0Z8H2_COCSC|nr:saccharopine dehydrogenase [Coccomyxa subellipsoidea C-169]EIE26941.1 saccharopine dehydrogenase [Coccomyxa subellipsoidea C-169]|eukprot:XP_005651485.1 saccharopine dehydrogenase [Coccomyxa subellipsoidea C-169]
MADRTYQVVIWGGTGFVGKLVAEHIARDYAGKFRWAMAARNKAKLEGVRNELVKVNQDLENIPLLIADTKDQASIDDVVKQAKVVIACAGPYAQLGTPVVDACVRLGTHYVDITGEVPWVARTIKKYHAQAFANRVKIVHMCGFDSIPSDLGAHLVATTIEKQYHRKTAKVRVLQGKAAGAVSGGTLASLMGAIFEETPEELKLSADPYALNPPEAHRGPDKGDFWGPAYDKLGRAWTMPFVMQAINTRVVRRSNALLGNAYGENFSFTEAMEVPNVFAAYLGSFALVMAYLVISVPFLRPLVMRLLPKPGEGPSKKQQVEGFWNARAIGVSEALVGEEPVKVVATLGGHRDPGYWETSRMLLESALCLAQQEEELKKAGKLQGGVLTPASAMGMLLIDRLNKAGMTFKIESSSAAVVSEE